MSALSPAIGRKGHAPVGAAKSNSEAGRWILPLAVFFLSRIFLFLLSVIAPHILPALHTNPILLPPGDPMRRFAPALAGWFRFDTGWYVGVSQHGYHDGRPGLANTNFMPLYPVLIRALQPLTFGSPWMAACVVANGSYLVSLVLLYRWAQRRWNGEQAFRVLLLITAFPFSIFFAAPYAEPIFLALAVATFLAAEQDRWPLAACCAGLATLTRPVGLAAVLGLVLLALQRGNRRDVLLSAGALLPLLGFVTYLTVTFGHPLALLTYHSQGWVAPHAGIIATIQSQFQTSLSPFDRIDALVSALFLLSTALVWKRLGPAYALYTMVGALLPLVHGLVCMERYVIVLFPVMAAWATCREWVVQVVFASSLVLLVLATIMYVQGFSLF